MFLDDQDPKFKDSIHLLLMNLGKALIVSQGGDDSIAATTVSFDHFDTDSNGKLSKIETEDMVNELTVPFDRSELNSLIVSLDVDHSSDISLDELQRLVSGDIFLN